MGRQIIDKKNQEIILDGDECNGEIHAKKKTRSTEAEVASLKGQSGTPSLRTFEQGPEGWKRGSHEGPNSRQSGVSKEKSRRSQSYWAVDAGGGNLAEPCGPLKGVWMYS